MKYNKLNMCSIENKLAVAKRLQRGVHAVAARRAGTRQGMLSHITFPYLIPALLISEFLFVKGL